MTQLVANGWRGRRRHHRCRTVCKGHVGDSPCIRRNASSRFVTPSTAMASPRPDFRRGPTQSMLLEARRQMPVTRGLCLRTDPELTQAPPAEHQWYAMEAARRLSRYLGNSDPKQQPASRSQVPAPACPTCSALATPPAVSHCSWCGFSPRSELLYNTRWTAFFAPHPTRKTAKSFPVCQHRAFGSLLVALPDNLPKATVALFSKCSFGLTSSENQCIASTPNGLTMPH